MNAKAYSRMKVHVDGKQYWVCERCRSLYNRAGGVTPYHETNRWPSCHCSGDELMQHRITALQAIEIINSTL